MTVALVIPVLNEEDAMDWVLDRVPERAGGHSVETYVIDGGSTDGTRETVQGRAELIEQSFAGGKGAAMQEAVEKTDADIYAFIDGDGTYDPEELGRLVDEIEDGADHVAGSRINSESLSTFNFKQLYGNKAFSAFFSLIYRKGLSDVLTGFRALDADFLEGLEVGSRGFVIETELAAKTVLRGGELREIDITFSERKGSSKLSFIRDGARIWLYAAYFRIQGLSR